MKNIILAATAIALVFASCKKDTKTTTQNTANSKTEFLTRLPWKITETRYRENNDPWDIYTPENCQKDDTHTFLLNKTYIWDNGALKCDPTANQKETSFWEFYDNQTKFAFDGDIFDIVTLDNNTFTLSYTEKDSASIVYVQVTFNH